jgi:hypothetical protein
VKYQFSTFIPTSSGVGWERAVFTMCFCTMVISDLYCRVPRREAAD